MIARYDVWARPIGLKRVMQRMPAPTMFMLPQPARRTFAMQPAQPNAMDVYFEGDRFVVKAPLPGFKPEEIDVQVEQGVLTIRAEKSGEEAQKDRGYVIREHRSESFKRSLRLPKNADIDAVEATYENGMLTLAFPKAATPEPRRISVTTADHGTPEPSLGAEADASLPASTEAAAVPSEPAASSSEASAQPAENAAGAPQAAAEQPTGAASPSTTTEGSKVGSRKRAAKAPASA